jgi:GT2 family glycosyltransferase
MLARTLPTWAASARGRPVEFVFADHSPDDGCLPVIAGRLAGAAYRYLPDPANPGFAAGCNRAVAAASAPHVFLLNPDVWLDEDALDRVLAAVEREPASPVAVGLAVRGVRYTGIDLHPVSLFVDRRARARRPPLGPSGGAAVFPVGLFAAAGGFCEHLFAWGEDADLAFRLYAGGVRTRALDLGLPHAQGHSVAGDRGLTARRAFLLARNRLLVAARNLTWPLLLLTLPVLAAAQLALAARRARQGLLRPFLRGVARGVAEAPAARRGRPGERFGLAALAGLLRSGRG